jgi:ribonuclease P protein component
VLPASQRVRRREEFAAAMRGYRASVPPVTIHVALPTHTAASRPGADRGTVRVGFIVNKTVGGAVIRNKVKRRLRHLMSRRRDVFPRGAVVVVRAGTGAARVPSAQLAVALDSAIAKFDRFAPFRANSVGGRVS